MFQSPKHNYNMSLRLSEVLGDIGVTETMVKKTRRAWMIKESLWNAANFLMEYSVTTSFFGSQSEVSTTLGLHSDTDLLCFYNPLGVILDLSQWNPVGLEKQYLMIQDETTSPGYCLLQRLRDDAPLPADNIHDKEHYTYIRGRALLRHSACYGREGNFPVHGPAELYSGGYRSYDYDFVLAFRCSSLPREADPWLHHQSTSGWPTENLKRYSAQQGCFVVPVCSKTSIYQDLEWRISYSYTERCLMFNLNITQIMCYILMKMILSTFLKPKFGDTISSFMCKNVLFHLIADSEASHTWNEGSLLTWLNQSMHNLLHCILTENCPHFVIHMNNLLAGKLSPQVKRELEDVMRTVTGNIEQSLLGIHIDALASRLYLKSGGIIKVNLMSKTEIAYTRAIRNVEFAANALSINIKRINNCISEDDDGKFSLHGVIKLCLFYIVGNDIQKGAIRLLTPFLFTSMGSILASVSIHQSQVISPETMILFSLGLNSDISSSRLKLASALYFAGHLERCEIILAALKAHVAHSIGFSLCNCSLYSTNVYFEDFGKLCYENNENVINRTMDFCVTYLSSEVNCIPKELKYEMFRSTKEDRPYRGKYDYWMDWAVVDSLPYMFFLQYKVYNQLHRPADQLRALYNLAWTIKKEIHLGHRETAFNLLGQCMVQENRHNDALYCYTMSLNIRPRNNAAQWHLCMLLARLLR